LSKLVKKPSKVVDDEGNTWPNLEAYEASLQAAENNRDTIDPRGFIHKDIQILRKHLPRLGYTKGDTLEDIAYRQGQTDMIDRIERYIIRGK
jgi:hypothetical protein